MGKKEKVKEIKKPEGKYSGLSEAEIAREKAHEERCKR